MTITTIVMMIAVRATIIAASASTFVYLPVLLFISVSVLPPRVRRGVCLLDPVLAPKSVPETISQDPGQHLKYIAQSLHEILRKSL